MCALVAGCISEVIVTIIGVCLDFKIIIILVFLYITKAIGLQFTAFHNIKRCDFVS